jgi:hypothetical protein
MSNPSHQARERTVLPLPATALASRPMPGGEEIEVVRGSLDEQRSEDVLRFWGDHGVLNDEAGRERLPGVVSVAVNDSGEIVGVNSIDRAMPRPPARPMWVYRSFLAEKSDPLWREMFTTAFDALESEFDPGAGSPSGCASSWMPPRQQGGPMRSGRRKT